MSSRFANRRPPWRRGSVAIVDARLSEPQRRPRDPWLEPDISKAIRALDGRPAVVTPIGFLCDHVEVLYDLDVEAAKTATRGGVKMVRAATVADHPAFIEMMADIVNRHLGALTRA